MEKAKVAIEKDSQANSPFSREEVRGALENPLELSSEFKDVARVMLESYDRNDNFGHQLVQAEQFNMNVPEQSGYKDINSEVNYTDLKENSKAMYKAKFLRSIRLASQKEDVYICGLVSAEMYKKSIYDLDIQLDSLGVVQQCQCECAAGMGPEAHCKHVGLVLQYVVYITFWYQEMHT
ncbi:hypothetical protein LSH36_487g00008 [Paralvinella palmiformis]|uniref:SWIM-type domain-containing protein n=1 Tax=Paralvinella palmiformis TaxID=53620 RepID=A0AAD9J9K7_9ANNE|nr:hypothetical protein LSH36_487g00008 [Paralvinella palmiformis]